MWNMVDAHAAPTRERIIAAAAELLAEGGTDAVSTRAVSAAAHVQAPTLYRLFGDKQGLLDAVTAYGFEHYLADSKALAPTGDPVADLRRGWDNQVEFGLTQPAFYVLMYGSVRPERRHAAADTARNLLLALLDRVAAAGRLRMPPEAAADVILAANTGVTLALIATPPADRDPELSARTREIILAAVTTPADPDSARQPAEAPLAARALALDAALDTARNTAVDATRAGQPGQPPLSPAEAALLHDWLLRLAT